MAQVGGRLKLFVESWRRLKVPASVIKTVEGFEIPFSRRPPTSFPSEASMTVIHDAERAAAVDEEVKTLLEKGAIHEVPPSRGYYSRLFLVPKPVGWRPIINLKRLNADFIETPHFRMDTTKDVANLLQPGDWAATIDLKDAYFHVPIGKRSRKFLRFGWRGRWYEFPVLPFGLSPAPLVFTRLTKPLKALLQQRGIRSIFYLDDVLIVAKSKQECEDFVQQTLTLLQEVGFLINFPKSSLSPSQTFKFLGLWWDTKAGMISIDEEKRLAMSTRASKILSIDRPSCRTLQTLLGHMTACLLAVPLLRLHCRFLQRDVNRVYRLPSDINKKVILSQESIRDLRWTSCLGAHQCKNRMWAPLLESCEMEVATDASDIAWGIYFEGKMHHGEWAATNVAVPLHINVKEILALKVFISDFLPPSADGRSLLWRTDNTTALSYIKKEGGTISLPLLIVAREILLELHRRRIEIVPVFVASEENLHADAASRLQSLPDWHLPRLIFDRIAILWGCPDIDLFATKESSQVQRFFAWGRDEEAEAFDALAQLWNFKLAYAFPPPQIIPRVLQKIEVSSGTFILVTPFWPAQKWFASIQLLRVVEVRRIPPSPPVIDLQTNEPPLRHLPLLVWRISGGCMEGTSPTAPSDSSATVGDPRQRRDMTLPGQNSRIFFEPNAWDSIKSI